MNEFQALMGILVLKHMDSLIDKGRMIEAVYRERLANIPGIKLPPPLPSNIKYNHAYMPVEVNDEEFGMSRDALYDELKKYNVFARKYFYPLLTDFACYKSIHTQDPLSVAKGVAQRILCLPTYYKLGSDEVAKICEGIQNIDRKI